MHNALHIFGIICEVVGLASITVTCLIILYMLIYRKNNREEINSYFKESEDK
jgi:hypothetical protein